MKTWQKKEYELCNILQDVFGCSGVVVTNLAQQYADIDVRDRLGNDYSVKYQPSSEKTGNFAFEYKLENPENGQTTEGSFLKCKANRYAIFREFKGTEWCFLADYNLLEFFVLNENSFRTIHTKSSTEKETNSDRFYSRGHCYLVPVKDLYHQPWMTVFVKKNGKWVLHNKKRK